MTHSPDRTLLNQIEIRLTRSEDADELEELTGIIYHCNPREDAACFTADHYRQHVQVFPEAQFVAVDTTTGKLVGLTSGMRMHYDPARPPLMAWWELVGNGWLTTHDPRGEWMYGVESAVHPDYRGCGVGSRLMDARFNVLREMNLRGMVAGSAIIDYAAVADQIPVETYVAEVVAGERFDTNLSKQLHKGFRAVQIIPNYLPDPETAGYGVLIVCENPQAHPPHKAQHRGTGLYPANPLL